MERTHYDDDESLAAQSDVPDSIGGRHGARTQTMGSDGHAVPDSIGGTSGDGGGTGHEERRDGATESKGDHFDGAGAE